MIVQLSSFVPIGRRSWGPPRSSLNVVSFASGKIHCVVVVIHFFTFGSLLLAWASHCRGFFCRGAQARGCVGCGSRSTWARELWHRLSCRSARGIFPDQGSTCVSALTGRFLCTVPPGKSKIHALQGALLWVLTQT